LNDDTDNGLWRALADGTRRELLDLLAAGPCTTNDLVGHFSMSRFGVMKHLGVLENAGLVLVRWVRRHAQPAAASLLRLQELVEQPSTAGNAMTTEDTNLSFHIEQEISLRATKVGRWWGHHIGPKDSTITLDARVGGYFIERWGDGEGELYATVTFMRLGEKITMEGGMGMSGPGYSKFSYALTEDGDTTTLKLSHYCHGHRDPEVRASFAEGWKELLEGNFSAWVHEGKAAE